MVRISDIFKKLTPSHTPRASEVKPQKGPAQQETNPEILDTRPPKAIPQKEEAEAEEYSSMRIAKAMQEAGSDKARSQNLYLAGIQLIKEALIKAEELKPINLVQIEQWVSEVVDCLISSDTELLCLFYEYTSENYLYSHMVNTTIVSAEIGLGLGYNKSQLNELGLASFLHDIGMVKVEKLGMEARGLSEEEYTQIKNHPVYGADILSKIQGISEPVIYVAKEEHERMNGTGYPQGLKGKEISEYARILAIADVYEALTHNRPYRKKILSHEAIKELITNNPLFDSAFLKVLINKFGVYPIGSWVELNSNEIGKVMINNNEFPLRPVLYVLFDAAGHKPKAPRVINLTKQLNLFIKKPLTDDELAKKIKEPVESQKEGRDEER